MCLGLHPTPTRYGNSLRFSYKILLGCGGDYTAVVINHLLLVLDMQLKFIIFEQPQVLLDLKNKTKIKNERKINVKNRKI